MSEYGIFLKYLYNSVLRGKRGYYCDVEQHGFFVHISDYFFRVLDMSASEYQK